MVDDIVRRLCAQVALETDQRQFEVLIAELALIIGQRQQRSNKSELIVGIDNFATDHLEN